MFSDCVDVVESGSSLTEVESKACLETIFSTEQNPELVKRLLIALNQKGESVDEIVGFAKAMRQAMTKLPLPGLILDTCGTGGSGKSRFNTSTAAAFVLAAGGVKVAKHGNRGSKLANGSVDFLESLGIPLDLTPMQLQDIFDKTGLCFLFARQFHPAMAKVAAIRQEIGHRTIFNLLGPLCNPAGAQYHAMGTTTQVVAEKMAQALQRLGVARALVSYNSEGIDELSMTVPSTILEVTQDGVRRFEFRPKTPQSSLIGGLSVSNADLFNEVFSTGNLAHEIAQHVCLNAGAGFYCVGQSASIQEGQGHALELVKSGEVWRFFSAYCALANER